MKILLLALALSAAALAHASDYAFKEPFSRTAPFSPTGEVTLANVNGSVDIRTWDKNEILIAGEKSAKTAEELKLIELTIDLSDAHAVIKVHLPKNPDSFWSGNTIHAAVRFTLTVPAGVALDQISTVNSSISVDGVRGAVNLESVNGGIRATGLAADARLHTVNGSVHATFATLAAHQQLSFDSVNGPIVVTLPKDAGAALHASTVNGGIDCDFPLTLSGGIRWHNLSGTFGDGRASIRANTVNGGIRLKSL